MDTVRRMDDADKRDVPLPACQFYVMSSNRTGIGHPVDENQSVLKPPWWPAAEQK